jgi:hypothetical protein
MKTILNEHVLTKTIRDFLVSEGVDLLKVEKFSREKTVIWDLKFESVEVLIMLYLVKDKEVFLWIQALVSRLDRITCNRVYPWLLKENHKFPHPFKFAVDKKSESVLLVMRSSARWISGEQLLYRLTKIGPFADEMQERLKREFGLRAFGEGQDVMPE